MCWHEATVGDGDMGFLGFWIQELSFCLPTKRWICSFQGVACVCVCARAHTRAKSLQSYPTL